LSHQLVGVLDAGCCTQDERPFTLRVVLWKCTTHLAYSCLTWICSFKLHAMTR
jgi:hypothetical protein